MRLKSGFVLEEVAGTFLAVAVGERAEELKVLIKLNSTGAFLWKILAERDVTEEELVLALLAEYDVARDIAAADVHRIVEQLRENNIFI